MRDRATEINGSQRDRSMRDRRQRVRVWRVIQGDGNSQGKMCMSVNPKEWVKIRDVKD